MDLSSEQIQKYITEFAPVAVGYLVRIVGVLVALWIAFKIAGALERRIRAVLEGRNFDQALCRFFASIVRWLVILAAVIGCLGVFGIETTSFAAVLGAAGVAIGLAFQGTLSNFSAGIMILTFRPFTIDDYIKAASTEGIVAEIGLFVTELNTLDNRRIFVPNSEVIGGIIENYTRNPVRRVDIDVGVAYEDGLERTRQVLSEAAAAVPGRDPGKGHEIFLKGLGESSVDWQVRVWCKAADYWDVWDATTHATKSALDKAGLTIPFPQLDVHPDAANKVA